MIVKIELTINFKTKQFFTITIWYSVLNFFNDSWPINIHQ